MKLIERLGLNKYLPEPKPTYKCPVHGEIYTTVKMGNQPSLCLSCIGEFLKNNTPKIEEVYEQKTN